MKLFTRYALLALPLLIVPILVGCGGGSNNGPSKNTPIQQGPAPSASELTGKIIYSQSSRGADQRLISTGYIANADGTQIMPFSPKQNGTLSPDGTKIVFNRYDSTTRKSGIYTANADGSNEILIVEGQGLRAAMWSPDSRTLVYGQELERNADNTPNIFISLVNADGMSAPRRFPGIGQINFSPSFSRDGNSLLYVASSPPNSASGGSKITLAALDGSNPRVLVANDEGLQSPTYSPDGERIAYTLSSGNGGYNSVYVVDRDGRNSRFIANGTEIFPLKFSPDGQFLAYSSGSSRAASIAPDQPAINIYIARADGSSKSRLFMSKEGRGSQYVGSWVR